MELPDKTLILVNQGQIEKLIGEVAAMRKHLEKADHVSGIGYISIKSVCKQLDCSKQFVYDLQRRGSIKLYKLGSRTFVSVRELETVIENGKS